MPLENFLVISSCCLFKVIYNFRVPCFVLVFVGSLSFGMMIWYFSGNFINLTVFDIITYHEYGYMVTKESYVTMMGPIGRYSILSMIAFAFKYHSEHSYSSRTSVVCIHFGHS